MYERASKWSGRVGGGGVGEREREKIGKREREHGKLVDFVLLPPIRPFAISL